MDSPCEYDIEPKGSDGHVVSYPRVGSQDLHSSKTLWDRKGAGFGYEVKCLWSENTTAVITHINTESNGFFGNEVL